MTRRRSRARSLRAAGSGLARPSFALAVLVVGLLLASTFVAIDAQRNALGRDAASLQADIVATGARIAGQQADIAEKQTDGYVMDKARVYGYVKPGEALIGVRREPVALAPGLVLTRPSRLDRWIALFLGSR